jgi:hypothetical protein
VLPARRDHVMISHMTHFQLMKHHDRQKVQLDTGEAYRQISAGGGDMLLWCARRRTQQSSRIAPEHQTKLVTILTGPDVW